MSANKIVWKRRLVVDRCLRDKTKPKGYQLKEIMDKCNYVLKADEYQVTSPTTIREDIREIEDYWWPQSKIIKTKGADRRELYYQYENLDFTINQEILTDQEFAKLDQAIKLLSRFDGLPQFEWIDEMRSRLKSVHSFAKSAHRFANKEQMVISFDENKEVFGKQYISLLFDAITSRQTLNITYQPYYSEQITYVFSPYFLKEYLNRWFVLGQTTEYDSITIFALDRIKEIESSTETYLPNDTIDFNTYFDDIIGVSMVPDQDKEVIRLKVSDAQYPYIESKPIHHSQRVVSDEPGNIVIEIEVIPNPELIQRLLSFGDNVVVMMPKSLQENIASILLKSISQYKESK